jgi:hypothetical protein
MEKTNKIKTIFIDCGSNLGQGYTNLTNILQLENDDTLKYINTIAVEWHPDMRKDNCKDISYYVNEFTKNNAKYVEWF